MTDQIKPKTLVRVRMDSQLKEDFETILGNMGLDISTAMMLLARKVVADKRFPFVPSIPNRTPNKTTLKAIKEGRKILEKRKVK